MEWLTSTAQNLFQGYFSEIQKLPQNRTLSRKALLNRHFRLYSEDGIEIYYAPVGYVRRKAKIVLIGVTPGWSQMELSYRTTRSLIERSQDTGRILSKAKQKIAFAGSMRRNLIKMLDQLCLPEYLYISSSDNIFCEKTGIVHSTSALRYPVFYRGNNYTGHKPKILSQEIFRIMIVKLLGSELRQVPNALIIPLGNAASKAIEHLVECGVMDKRRCLFGFPHPSGANAHRVKQFTDGRKRLKNKLRMWFEENSQQTPVP